MSLDPDTRQAIETLLADNPVVLFMKGNRAQPQCGFSAKTVSALDMLVPDYLTVDVLQHPEIREGIKVFGNWPTVPQVYVKGELIGGCDIIQEMLNSGELAEVLEVEAPALAGPPDIKLNTEAVAVMKEALESQPTMALHLQIDAGWSHALSLSAPSVSGVEVDTGEVTLRMDPWSAARADGLRITLDESLTGTRFIFDNPNAPPPVNQLTVQQLKAKFDAGGDVHLFDVRSTEERNLASIDGATPWGPEAMALIESLSKDAELIFYCHTGNRSQSAAEHFRRLGYANVNNLAGGIKAWSAEIDSSVPDYSTGSDGDPRAISFNLQIGRFRAGP